MLLADDWLTLDQAEQLMERELANARPDKRPAWELTDIELLAELKFRAPQMAAGSKFENDLTKFLEQQYRKAHKTLANRQRGPRNKQAAGEPQEPD